MPKYPESFEPIEEIACGLVKPMDECKRAGYCLVQAGSTDGCSVALRRGPMSKRRFQRYIKEVQSRFEEKGEDGD